LKNLGGEINIEECSLSRMMGDQPEFLKVGTNNDFRG
jgi:hypothetical protein